jgi:hypothetical protein
MVDDSNSLLAGAAFELANAGYTPMPDADKREEKDEIGSDSNSLREAAERISTPPSEVVVREYRDRDGEPVAANEAITLARASRDYASATAAEKLVAENANAQDLAARVDALRAEVLARDPEAAEFYGFELPEDATDRQTKVESSGPDSGGNSNDADNASAAKLDPELEKALLHPQVRQAIEEQLDEVHKARQGYVEGLAVATQIAQASFLSQFPELAAIAPQDLPGTLEQMSRDDPAKLARVQAMVATTEHLFAQQQQASRLQAEMARQSFRTFAQSEDTRLDVMLKGEPKETQRAVTNEIIASAKEDGIEYGELMRLFESEPLMRNAVFQRMMYDAGKYRLMMKARDAVVAKPVPPVPRRGTARTPAERDPDLRTLSARLSTSGDIKDAVALYHARKTGRR